MNSKCFSLCAALVAGAMLAGCASSQYPMTYTVPIGTATVTSAYGPPNLVVNGVQDVSATPGVPLYYSAVSPVNVVVYVFDKGAGAEGPPILSQMQGTSFYSSVTPTSSTVEFVFSAAQPNTGGSVQLTISDTALVGTSNAVPYTSTSMGPAANAAQPEVTLSPTNATVAVGQPVTLTASGGAGAGAYVWSGAASASGSSNAFTFNAPGTYTESVYRAGDATYAQSNTATTTIVASAPGTPAPAYNSPVSVQPIR